MKSSFNLWAAQLILGSAILGGASPLTFGADPSAIPGAAVQPESGQVQEFRPFQSSDKPKVFGVKPVHVDIRWTAYYITPVEETTPDKGHHITVMDRQGNNVHVFLTAASYEAANMEAVHVGIDKKGENVMLTVSKTTPGMNCQQERRRWEIRLTCWCRSLLLRLTKNGILTGQ